MTSTASSILCRPIKWLDVVTVSLSARAILLLLPHTSRPSPTPSSTPSRAASLSARAILLLLPEWRLAAVLPHWREHGALGRLLSSLLALLPPCEYGRWIASANGSATSVETKGHGGVAGQFGLRRGTAPCASPAAGSGPKALPLLQLVMMIISLSQSGSHSPVIEEILRSPSDLAR
jgi:hypothetical protein